MGFNYQPGLWTLLALVPFIILYLIRPKHRKLKIPSLMFLLGENQSKKKVNFFRNLLKDPLILVQLALLLALAFAVAEPFLLLNKQEVATNTALVIDASASSQAMFNGRSRFEQSVEKAHDYVGGKMSIVLASQVPEIILEDGGKLQARNLLRTLRPSDTTTNIAGAMFLAKDILNGKKGQVIVFSDFITTSPEDNVLVAKRALNAQGIQVKFVNIFEPLDNIGIVDMEISNANVKSTIKNYGDAIKEVEINLVKDDAVEESTKITLAGNSVEFISFPTLSGISSIKINAQDPFLLDNTGYVSSPLGEKISVLMLTNDKDNFLRKALEAANIFHVEIREPPIVKAFELSHDIIIITDVTKTIVPSDTHDIKKYIEKGHTLIVAADEKTIQLGLEDLLPITSDKIGAASSVNVKIINTFTKDKDFGTTTMHIVAGPKENSIVYAVADDDSPLLSQQSLGEGTLFYYGIFDKSSDFKATQDYPIFWFTLLTNLLNTENIQDFNFKLSENPQFRHAGVFEIEGKMKAFNLLSEGESDIGKKSSLLEEDELAFAEKSYAAKAEYDLSLLLLFLGIGLLIFELFILKYRGEF